MELNHRNEAGEHERSNMQRISCFSEGAHPEAVGKRTAIGDSETGLCQSVLPVVSVIIPTYNRAWALQRAVRSIFHQAYRPIECLIIDDGSTDDTIDIINELAGERPDGIELKYFKKDNGGPNSARNLGLIQATGEYICYLDSDDLLLPDSIEERARALMNNPDVDFCYGLSSIRDEDGIEICSHNEVWPGNKGPCISRYLFDTNSPLIRRSICSQVGPWREDDSHGQEYEYFARLKYCSRDVYFINKVLSVYFRHNNECINDRSRSFWIAVFRITLAVKALVLYSKFDNKLERVELSQHFRGIAKKLYFFEDYINARLAQEEALILNKNGKFFFQWILMSIISFIFKSNQAKR